MLKKMTKRKLVTIGIVGFIVTLFATILLGVNLPDPAEVSSKVTVTVEDGVCTPKTSEFKFVLDKGGNDIITLEWGDVNAKQGYVTGAVVTDEAGREMCFVTGGAGYFEMIPMRLEAGIYNVNLTFFTTEEEYYDLLDKHDWETAGPFNFEPADGTYTTTYGMSVESATNWPLVLCVLCGFICGLFLALVFLAWTKKGDSAECKYDERQLLARGEAFRGGFFTLLIMMAVVMIFEIAKVDLPIDNTALMGICAFSGMSVFIGISIWKHAYYALNENSKNIVIIFALIGTANIGIAIDNILSNKVVVDGVIQGYGCLNMMCGLLFVVVAVVTGLRAYEDKKLERLEDEEDDDIVNQDDTILQDSED